MNWPPKGSSVNPRYIWILAICVGGLVAYAKLMAVSQKASTAHADVKLDTQNPMANQSPPAPTPMPSPAIKYIYINQAQATPTAAIATPTPIPKCDDACEDRSKEVAMYYEALHTGQGRGDAQTHELPQVMGKSELVPAPGWGIGR